MSDIRNGWERTKCRSFVDTGVITCNMPRTEDAESSARSSRGEDLVATGGGFARQVLPGAAIPIQTMAGAR
jgi:hypothetical protein